MPCRFVGEDDAASRRPGQEVRLSAEVAGDELAHLASDIGPLEDAELFDVSRGVAATGKLEVSAQDSTARLEFVLEVRCHTVERIARATNRSMHACPSVGRANRASHSQRANQNPARK